MAYKKPMKTALLTGATAFGTGFVAELALKVAAGTPIVAQPNPLAFVDPRTPKGLVGLGAAALGIYTTVKGHKEGKNDWVYRIAGYSLLAVLGATAAVDALDPAPEQTPNFVPRATTRVPLVRAEYQDWIPGYAPGVTFPVVQPTPPGTNITDVYTEVPHYSNVF